jgi:hypothetical protein
MIMLSASRQGAEEFPWKNKALALDHWLRHADPPGAARC